MISRCAVRSRERLAVVGPSGAGKTTLFQLAERFYDPSSGRILLDGVDLRDADPADIRQRIAMVPQDTVIFAASARDNLRYGNWDATEDAAVAGRARCERGGLPARAAGGARHLHGRRRCTPVRRSAPAHRDRPRVAARRAAAAARRSDIGARRRERAARSGRARPPDGAPHDDRHRAPPGDRPSRRPDRGDGRQGGSSRKGRTRASARAAASTRGSRGCSSRIARLRRSPPPPPRPPSRRSEPPPRTPPRPRDAGRRASATCVLRERDPLPRAAGLCGASRLRRMASPLIRIDASRRAARARSSPSLTNSRAPEPTCACAAARARAARLARAARAASSRRSVTRTTSPNSCRRSRCLRIVHLPDITRCAASATASAISEPSLVALATDVARRLAGGVRGVETRVADRAARLGAGADCRSRRGEAGGEHFLAHRGLGELVDRVVAA